MYGFFSEWEDEDSVPAAEWTRIEVVTGAGLVVSVKAR